MEIKEKCVVFSIRENVSKLTFILRFSFITTDKPNFLSTFVQYVCTLQFNWLPSSWTIINPDVQLFQLNHVSQFRVPTTWQAVRWPRLRAPARAAAVAAAAAPRLCRPLRLPPPLVTTARMIYAASLRRRTTNPGPQALALCRPERGLERMFHQPFITSIWIIKAENSNWALSNSLMMLMIFALILNARFINYIALYGV